MNTARATVTILLVILNLFFVNCAKMKFSPVPQAASVNIASVARLPASVVEAAPVMHKSQSTFQVTGNKLDIALVIDDSGSMEDDSAHLAARLNEFVGKLSSSGFDWQMCIITTNMYPANGGMPRSWSFPAGVATADIRVVNSQTASIGSVFTNTVNEIVFKAPGSGDERGIAALRRFVDNKSMHNCLRAGASFTSILISDEDERSEGGLGGIQIEEVDTPEGLIASVGRAGVSKYVANSIIIKTGDQDCLAEQNYLTLAFSGSFYERLSNLTKGGVGSICAADYSANLNLFFDRITNGARSIKLDCEPLAGSVQVKVDQAANTYSYATTVDSVDFKFSKQAAYQAEVVYLCK